MTQPSEGPSATGVPTCYRHPGRETWIRCQRCDRSICPDCMNDAAVGFQCPECVRQAAKGSRQHQALYGGRRSGDPRLTSYVLIAINLAVWLAIVATGWQDSRLGTRLGLLPTGRCESRSVPGAGYNLESEAACATSTQIPDDGSWVPGVADGAWWQLVTAAFTHVEIWHVAMNMFALFVFGPTLERIVGRTRFLAVNLLSALASSVLVIWLSNEYSSTVGASGAIFGILGALLVLARKARLESQWLVQNLVIGVVITVVGWRFISWQGHLGGVLAGALAAAIVAYAPRHRRALVQWVGLAVLGVVLLGTSLLRALSLG